VVCFSYNYGVLLLLMLYRIHCMHYCIHITGEVVSNLSASDFKGKSTTELRARPGKHPITVSNLSAVLTKN
jgi:hypothetical protein